MLKSQIDWNNQEKYELSLLKLVGAWDAPRDGSEVIGAWSASTREVYFGPHAFRTGSDPQNVRFEPIRFPVKKKDSFTSGVYEEYLDSIRLTRKTNNAVRSLADAINAHAGKYPETKNFEQLYIYASTPWIIRKLYGKRICLDAEACYSIQDQRIGVLGYVVDVGRFAEVAYRTKHSLLMTEVFELRVRGVPNRYYGVAAHEPMHHFYGRVLSSAKRREGIKFVSKVYKKPRTVEEFFIRDRIAKIASWYGDNIETLANEFAAFCFQELAALYDGVVEPHFLTPTIMRVFRSWGLDLPDVKLPFAEEAVPVAPGAPMPGASVPRAE